VHRLAFSEGIEVFFLWMKYKMSSVTRFLKQIPTDTPYFYPLNATLPLNQFIPDAASSTTAYGSGQAPGRFSTTTVTCTTGTQSSLTLFRDMGVTIVSSGRTFRRIQQLGLTGGAATDFTSSGVWTNNSNFGVGGTTATAGVDNGYQVYYFETGWDGQGLAAGLIRYG
jgi:hypothetical protein